MAQPELESVVAAVRRVGDEVVLPRFMKVAPTRKADGSVLTEADVEAQEALRRELRAIADYPLVGEEMSGEEQRRSWEAGAEGLWCVDPIDGTSNFVAGLQHFAISVAFMRGGRPVLGVVYAPALDEMFAAEAGGGAFLNGRRLPLVATAANIGEAMASVDFKRLPENMAAALAVAPPYHSQRNLGSAALDWCYLAAGRFDLYLHGGQYLWDYAAGCLLLQECGGKMRTLEAADYWAGDVWRKSVIAASTDALFDGWCGWLADRR